jgi:hypothetical protein
MSENKEEKKITLPYLPYKTLLTFFEKLKVGIPARIDRGVMSSFSGAAQASLFTALKYLQLINRDHIPTEKLTKIVLAEGEERKKFIKEMIISSYPFLFKEGIDLKRITALQLQELFEKAGASGGTLRKSITFFMAAAKDATIELSPHLKVKTGRIMGKTKKGGGLEKSSKNDIEEEKELSTLTWQQLLATKFPKFDPAWPDDVKTKWFDGFKELMGQFKEQSKKKE